jgi:hypothetical protein
MSLGIRTSMKKDIEICFNIVNGVSYTVAINDLEGLVFVLEKRCEYLENAGYSLDDIADDAIMTCEFFESVFCHGG